VVQPGDGESSREMGRRRGGAWSPGFFEQFTPLSEDDARGMDEVLASSLAARTRKAPPKL
jgi:hypothetical protein